MAIAALFEAPKDGTDKYDAVLELQPGVIDQPARLYHVCFETNGGFTVLDVWESEEAFAKFGEMLMPAIQQAGLQVEPKIFPVHNTIT